MNPTKTLCVGLLVATMALAWSAAIAETSLLFKDYRQASQTDQKIMLGGGVVSASKVLPQGLHLAAPATKEGMPEAVATAVYRFKVPLAATEMIIEVGYHPDTAGKSTDVAGFLFVRNLAMDRQPVQPENRPKPSGAPQPSFRGNIYPLLASKSLYSVTLPFEGYVEDGILEVHLTAGAGQAFEAEYVQVTSNRSVGNYSYGQGYQIPSGRANDPLYFNYGYGGGPMASQDPFFWNQFNQMQPYPYIYNFNLLHGGHGEHHGGHKK